MRLGNVPKDTTKAVSGKTYWWIDIGRSALRNRYFEGGWRGFEFCVLTPYSQQPEGEAHTYQWRFAFAFWFPFYML